jgi:hypothetical protein
LWKIIELLNTKVKNLERKIELGKAITYQNKRELVKYENTLRCLHLDIEELIDSKTYKIHQLLTVYKEGASK